MEDAGGAAEVEAAVMNADAESVVDRVAVEAGGQRGEGARVCVGELAEGWLVRGEGGAERKVLGFEDGGAEARGEDGEAEPDARARAAVVGLPAVGKGPVGPVADFAGRDKELCGVFVLVGGEEGGTVGGIAERARGEGGEGAVAGVEDEAEGESGVEAFGGDSEDADVAEAECGDCEDGRVVGRGWRWRRRWGHG